MAKVIRNRWVYRPQGKWHRYLPRRVDGVKEFNYEESGGTLNDFKLAMESDEKKLRQAQTFAVPGESLAVGEDKKEQPANKLWLTWLYRDLSTEPKWTKKYVENVFGKEWKVGRMEILKNTAATNEDLWKIKHLIELRPVSFPNGEPTAADVESLKIGTDGVVKKATEGALSEKELKLFDETKHFTEIQMRSQLARRFFRYKEIFEANVYTPSNITLIEK